MTSTSPSKPMSAKAAASALSFETLKAKQRSLRSAFPEPLGLRVHRAISWFGRAMAETKDPDVRFILLPRYEALRERP